MAVYTVVRQYRTKGHMGMMDVTDDFRSAVRKACHEKQISDGIVTGFTTGGVAALTTLEFEPGMVTRDLKHALDIISPYLDKDGRVVYYKHHETWGDDNGSSHIHHRSVRKRRDHGRSLAESYARGMRRAGPAPRDRLPGNGRVTREQDPPDRP